MEPMRPPSLALLALWNRLALSTRLNGIQRKLSMIRVRHHTRILYGKYEYSTNRNCRRRGRQP